ncbi:hypothetical protein [Erythrobacter donghaensis]|uniref:hypothetical protein n=2 Tax=Erythrobacter donghaensis TaxID=267135 RepID=UPI000AB69F71|nr:hypothetical protein [Erythrobacter donghaensis]
MRCIGAMTIAAFAALAAASPGFAQEAKKAIIVETPDPGAREVRFDGTETFSRQNFTHTASVSLGGGSVAKDISIDFGDFDLPLRLVISPRRSGNLAFAVARPRFTTCTGADVRRVSQAAVTGSTNERLSLMAEARRLIQLCGVLPNEVPKLVRKYYEASCSLAGDSPPIFEIHRDAATRFRQLPDSPEKRTALGNCTGRGQGADVRQTWSLAKTSDPAAARLLTAELLEKARDPEWQEAFDAVSIDAELVERLEVNLIKQQQIAASRESDLAAAIGYTNELERLARDEEFGDAVRAERLSTEGLEKDRAWFEARMNRDE